MKIIEKTEQNTKINKKSKMFNVPQLTLFLFINKKLSEDFIFP